MNNPFDRNKAVWRKSTRSNGNSGNCVEIAMVNDVVGLRDSKDPQGPVLVSSPSEWAGFVGGLKDGQFDLHRS